MKTYLKTCKFNKDFACLETMHVEIEQTFNEKLLALHPNDPTFDARKYLVNREKILTYSNSWMNIKRKIKNTNFSTLTIRSKILQNQKQLKCL